MSTFSAKLRAGEAVIVVVIGGSAPVGANLVGVTNTPAKVCDWLRARYPGARITLSNLAVPGMTSGWRYAEFGDVLATQPGPRALR